jgi:hypothetical protein
MTLLAKGDKVFDRDGRVWEVKRTGFDPGTKQNYYSITDGTTHGFVWAKTVEMSVKNVELHTCDTPNYTDGPCQVCGLEKAHAEMLRGIDDGPPNSVIRYSR